MPASPIGQADAGATGGISVSGARERDLGDASGRDARVASACTTAAARKGRHRTAPAGYG